MYKFIVLIALLNLINYSNAYCAYEDETCWPTTQDLQDLTAALDPDNDRDGMFYRQQAKHMSVPTGSPGDQPLYGNNVEIQPVTKIDTYQRACGICNEDSFGLNFCRQTVRNSPPANGTEPAFVAWPLIEDHVVLLMQFANKHDLCVSVTSSGRDRMNRDMSVGCRDGLLIRTSLLKDRTLDNSTNIATLGAGVTFSEFYHDFRDYYTATSYYPTDSVVGWLLNGGGYGPFGNNVGLGLDNIVWARVVSANGTKLIASDEGEQNAALMWALRGGGGNVFGVVTSIGIKVYPKPATGFSVGKLKWADDFVIGKGLSDFELVVNSYEQWMNTLSNKWSGTAQFRSLNVSGVSNTTAAVWEITMEYIFLGNTDDTEWNSTWNSLNDMLKPLVPTFESQSVDQWGDYYNKLPIDYIVPMESYPKGLPSILLNKDETAVLLKDFVKQRLKECLISEDNCVTIELYHAMGSTADADRKIGYFDIAASTQLRNAQVHVRAYPEMPDGKYDNFVDFKQKTSGWGAYFGESDIDLENFNDHYWNDQPRLEMVRKLYDPTQRFYCRQCCGSEAIAVNVNYTFSPLQRTSEVCQVTPTPPGPTPTPSNPTNGEGSSHWFLWTLFVVVLIVLIVIGFYCWKQQNNNSDDNDIMGSYEYTTNNQNNSYEVPQIDIPQQEF